ncbi:MAG: phosphotransferase [Planctomycetota bacterium]
MRKRPPGMDVELRIGNTPTVADILHIAENELTIEIAPTSDPPPPADSRLDGEWLNTPDGKPVRLSMVVLDAHDFADGPRRVLRMRPADDPTRAVLWYATELLGSRFHRESRHDRPDVPQPPRRGVNTEEARLDRLAWLREQTGAPLAELSSTRLDAARLKSNIENLIGAVEVPVGVAGPLLLHGAETQGFVYAPFATTEGALVASATRGAKAISLSGGATARVLNQHMIRVPVFSLGSLEGAMTFANWVRDHTHELGVQIREVSRHARLIAVEPIVIGRMVHVYFSYETGDAAGQNMTTACTWHASQWLLQSASQIGLEIVHFQIEANVSGDKKVTWRSFIAGRGIRVVAEAFLSAEMMQQILKVSPEQLANCHQAVLAGSINSGMVGYNINVANTVAAIFTATGQDIACVHESSIAQLHMQPVDGGLYATMLMPALIVGTVGGGTHLPAQQSLLEMMNCAGPGKVVRLAEIICGFALSLDLSTLSAVASGEFARAHERLGRNRPVTFLMRDELTPAFFQPALRHSLQQPALTITAVEPLDQTTGSSIVAELTARRVNRLIGLLPLRLQTSDGGTGDALDVIVKVKPIDAEVVLMVNAMASMCGPKVAKAHDTFRERTGFAACHLRELAIAGMTDARIVDHRPRVLQVVRDDAREVWLITMENLTVTPGIELLDSADDPSGWSWPHIEAALAGLAQIHSVWLDRTDELAREPWIGHVQTAASMVEMTPLWDALAQHAADEFPRLIDAPRFARWSSLIDTLDEWWPRLAALPRTLCHNDFNPRNIAMRRHANGTLQLVAYDWELATLLPPQHDVAELMAFVLAPDAPLELADRMAGSARVALQAATGRTIDAAQWREGIGLSLADLAVNRMALYLMAHTFRHYGFLERTVESLYRLLDHFMPSGE